QQTTSQTASVSVSGGSTYTQENVTTSTSSVQGTSNTSTSLPDSTTLSSVLIASRPNGSNSTTNLQVSRLSGDYDPINSSLFGELNVVSFLSQILAGNEVKNTSSSLLGVVNATATLATLMNTTTSTPTPTSATTQPPRPQVVIGLRAMITTTVELDTNLATRILQQ
ncbi:Nuclear migration protein unc-83, partial [Clarias magur]